MPALTVFLAPTGPATGLLDVLTDLSSGGLVDPFLWVDTADVLGSGDTVALSVEGGLRATTTVQATMVGARDLSRIRTCVLVPLQESVPVAGGDAEQALAQLVQNTSGGAEVTRVRCLLTRPGSVAQAGTSARQGWHNILVAPEESQGPGQGLSLLTPSTDPVDIGRHAAPVVAGLLGLWTGVDRCCLDGMPVPPGESIRAARGFYRKVDADDVEAELRRRVLATRPDLPLPRDQTVTSVYIDDPAGACRKMADNLWAKYPAVLTSSRQPPPVTVAQPVSFGQAMRWLLGFIWASLRNAPEDWFRGIVMNSAGKAAAIAQRAIVGAGDRTYNVVVHGMLPDGRPAGWQDVSAASGHLDHELGERRAIEQEARVNLAPLWKDYAAGALTLADGGTRGGDRMPPAHADKYRAVLRSVDDGVPTHESDFVGLSRGLAERTGTSRVPVGDVLGAEQLAQTLQGLTGDPSISVDAGRTLNALQAWRAHTEHTYAAHVGGRLYGQMLATRREVAEILRQLDAVANDAEGDEGRRWRRRLANVIFVLVVVGLLALAAIWVVAETFRAVTVRTAVIVTVAVVVIWLLGAVYAFVRSRQRMFQDLHRRRASLSEVDRLLINLRAALRDLRRLGDTYGQFLPWTRVIGVVLGSPFGPEPDLAAGRVPITRGLPHTTRVARARIDEAPLAEAAALLRRDLFNAGWLSHAWDVNLRDAASRLGSAGLDLVGNPEGMYDLQGQPVAGSPLEAWVHLLLREGTSPATGEVAWDLVRRKLAPDGGRFAELAVRLLSSVEGVGHGEQPTGALPIFLSGIDRPEVGVQRFLNEHFASDALAKDGPRVKVNASAVSRVGLSQVHVLAQLSDALPEWSFRANETSTSDLYQPGGALDGPAAGPTTPPTGVPRLSDADNRF